MEIADKNHADLESIVKTQCSHGNWNCNPYMHGMANGMILALATINGTQPKFLKAPDRWLDDAEVPTNPPIQDAKITPVKRANIDG